MCRGRFRNHASTWSWFHAIRYDEAASLLPALIRWQRARGLLQFAWIEFLLAVYHRNGHYRSHPPTFEHSLLSVTLMSALPEKQLRSF
jgi:hypothetical protein